MKFPLGTILLSLSTTLLAGCSSTLAVPTHSTKTEVRERVVRSQLRLDALPWQLPHASDSFKAGALTLGGGLSLSEAATAKLGGSHSDATIEDSWAGALEGTFWSSRNLGWTLSAQATRDGLSDARVGWLLTGHASGTRFSGRFGGGRLVVAGDNDFVRESRVDTSPWRVTELRSERREKAQLYLALAGSAQPMGSYGPWVDIQVLAPTTLVEWRQASTNTTTTYKVVKEDCSQGVLGVCPSVEYDSVAVVESKDDDDPAQARMAMISIGGGWVMSSDRWQWVLGVRYHPLIERTSFEISSSFLALGRSSSSP
jgi:hypothetical protein